MIEKNIEIDMSKLTTGDGINCPSVVCRICGAVNKTSPLPFILSPIKCVLCGEVLPFNSFLVD
jgi:hypothetical protein